MDTSFLHGIDVSINGSAPLHFGLDTGGAADFFISPGKAQQLGLPVAGHRTIHVSDRKDAESKVVDIVQAKTLAFAGHTFTESVGLASEGRRGDGVLGITLFRDVLLTLDYPHDRLTVSEGSLPPPNGHDVFLYTTFSDAAFPVLRVSPTVTVQIAGQDLPALLDSGARRIIADIIVPTKVAATLPLGPTEGDAEVGGSFGQRFPGYVAKLKGNLTFGDVVIQNPSVMVSDYLGFIDLAGVQNRLAYTIDQRNHRLRITMPDASAH